MSTRTALAKAYSDGYNAATTMARCYGHTDNWPAEEEPRNPYDEPADEATGTPSETLRAAAARLRQIADAATPGPWAPMWEEADGWWTVTGAAHGKMICPEVLATDSKDDAAYIATMHPGVAVALARWLDSEAVWGANGYALNVARAVLGEA